MKKIKVLILSMVILAILNSCTPSIEHECENSCPECGMCLNEFCEESVCNDKCECSEDKNTEETVYELLSRLSKEEYSKIVVDVCTITNGVELKANYTLTNNLVEYEIEQLSKLPEDGNVGEMPSAFKNTIMGIAEVNNGNIIKLDGESVSLPSYNELKGAFNFNKSNFKNVDASTKGTFYANVVYPSQFFGTPTSVKNVKVLVEYSITSLETITIDYETNSSIVRISYKFDK